MSTLITRTNWTDDTGTPAAPNADGTEVNDAELQKIYQAIDDLIAGSLAIGGVLTVEGFGTHSFSASSAGDQEIQIENTLAGTGNKARFLCTTDGAKDTLVLEGLSASFTPTAIRLADGGLVEAPESGGLTVVASNAAGVIRFSAGGVVVQHTIDATGVFNFQEGLRFNNIITPSAMSGQTDDYNPTGLDACNVMRVSVASALSLTGITAQEDGRIILFIHLGGGVLTIEHENAGSVAANRFSLPSASDNVLANLDTMILIYDGTSSRWRSLSHDS